MNNISTTTDLERLLKALGEQLDARSETYDLVVIGGSGLLALGIIDRPTLDVDVVALGTGEGLVQAQPLPDDLSAAIAQVANDFNMDSKWLNAGPADLLTWGLPEGFEGRLTVQRFGDSLTVRFASRYDQIHFKLYALVDRGPGKHEADLELLKPTEDELLEAARWATTQDPSPEFHGILIQALNHLGVEDADQRI